jgi:hypothetical protein
MIRASFSFLLVGLGLFLLGAVFVARFRPHWKGTKISSGPLGCAGFGLLLISGGISEFHFDGMTQHLQVRLTWVFIGGWIVAIIGFALDLRRAKRAGAMESLQVHLITKRRGNHDA